MSRSGGLLADEEVFQGDGGSFFRSCFSSTLDQSKAIGLLDGKRALCGATEVVVYSSQDRQTVQPKKYEVKAKDS